MTWAIDALAWLAGAYGMLLAVFVVGLLPFLGAACVWEAGVRMDRRAGSGR